MDRRIKRLAIHISIAAERRCSNERLTSHTNVSLSCHLAFSGRNAFAAVDAPKPMSETAAREYAEVVVKNSGAAVVSTTMAAVVVVGVEVASHGLLVVNHLGSRNFSQVTRGHARNARPARRGVMRRDMAANSNH